MVHSDGSQMVLAFVGLSCQDFSVAETCDKGWTQGCCVNEIFGWCRKCLRYNNSVWKTKSDGFDAGMLYVYAWAGMRLNERTST